MQAMASFSKPWDKKITAAALIVFPGNHAEAPADLSMSIDGTPNTVLMPGLDCSPDGPLWTNFANFCQILGSFLTGKR